MKGVLMYLGMGSCVSARDQRSDGPHSSMRIIKRSTVSSKSNSTVGRAISVQTPVFEAAGTKEEMFFDSKPWLDSDDEDYVSVNGDMSSPPVNQVNGNGDYVQGRRLSELFLESSFGSDSQTSLKAMADANCIIHHQKSSATITKSMERKKSNSGRSSAHNRCLPSLVRTLSCGDRKKIGTGTQMSRGMGTKR